MKLCVYCDYNHMTNICKGDNTERKYDKLLPRIVLVIHGYLISLFSKHSDSVCVCVCVYMVGKETLGDCPPAEPSCILSLLTLRLKTHYATTSVFGLHLPGCSLVKTKK